MELLIRSVLWLAPKAVSVTGRQRNPHRGPTCKAERAAAQSPRGKRGAMRVYLCKYVGVLAVCALFALLPREALAQNEPLQPVAEMPMFGNYCLVEGGVSLRDAPYTGSFTVDVPGTPRRAYWFWTGRSRSEPFAGDDDIVIVHNGAAPVAITATDSHASLDQSFSWHTHGYRDVALHHVAPGFNTYDVSGLSINGENLENHGVGLVVIAESAACPYTRVHGWYGLDSFRMSRPEAPFGPDSEIVCDSFEPAAVERTLLYHLVVGGVANPERGNSIWYVTGTGAPPNSIVPDADDIPHPDASEIVDPLNGDPGLEWDFNDGTIPIPPGDTHLCIQLESPEDDHGISAVWAGLLTSMAGVTSTPPPDIALAKTPDTQTVVGGAPVTFTLHVTNTGSITLSDVTVDDILTPACNASLGEMAPGAVSSYTCVLPAADSDFADVAEVSGQPPSGPPVAAHDDADVLVIHPTLAITKVPDAHIIIDGESVLFVIQVTNTGDVPLANVVVTDPLTPQCDTTIGELQPRESVTYECLMPVVTRSFVNTAMVEGDAPAGPPVSAQDSAEVLVITPAIALEKLPNEQTVLVSDTVTFTLRVENVGDVMLHDVVVSDLLTPDCAREADTLVPGDVITYTCTLSGVQADFTNVATVTGQPSIGPPVRDRAEAAVQVTGGALATLGDRIWLDENNDGIQDVAEPGLPDIAVTLYNAAASVIRTTTTDVNGFYSFTGLEPGEYSVGVTLPDQFIFSPHNVGDNLTHAEAIDSDVNGATGRTAPFTFRAGQNDTTWDAGLFAGPDLQIVKSDGGAAVQPGDTIRYTLIYSNAGPVEARGVTITEVVPDHTTFDLAASTSGWECENGATAAGTVCIFAVGTVAAGAHGEVNLVFVVQIDPTLPGEVAAIFNNVLINAENGVPGGDDNNSSQSFTPLAPPTALDETDEPARRVTIYIPLVNR